MHEADPFLVYPIAEPIVSTWLVFALVRQPTKVENLKTGPLLQSSSPHDWRLR